MKTTVRNLLPRLLAAAALLVPLGARASELPEPLDLGGIKNQMQVMSRVLEDSLNESGLEGWYHRPGMTSSFEPKIRAEYVPGVGATFTIPVSFPLIDHEARRQADAEREAEQEESRDLWEKHANEEDRPAQIRWRTRSRGRGGRSENSFDESKLSDLRRTLIETLAAYGHRMADLADSEKIVLVATSRRSFRIDLRMNGLGGLSIRPPSPPAIPFSAGEPVMIDIIEDDGVHIMIDQEVIENGNVRQIERRARQKAMGQVQRAQRQVREARRDMKRIQEQIVRVYDGSPDDYWAGLYTLFNPRSMSGRDHYAILINKSDLTGDMTSEDLETRIVEYRY